MAKLSKEYLVQAVRNHAKHYEDAGWDVVTETVSDEQIAALLTRMRSVTGAVNLIAAEFVGPYVMQMVETRPGEDSDPQLKTLERYNEERRVSAKDATLWWPEDRRKELLDMMAQPESGAFPVPAPRTEAPAQPAPAPAPEPEEAKPAKRASGGSGTRSRRTPVKA